MMKSVREIILECIGEAALIRIPEINDHMTLSDLHLDSLDRVDLQIQIETAIVDTLGAVIGFDYEELTPEITVGSLIEQVEVLTSAA